MKKSNLRFSAESLCSQARSAEIIRVARAEYEKQHAQTVKMINNSELSEKSKRKILKSLCIRTRV